VEERGVRGGIGEGVGWVSGGSVRYGWGLKEGVRGGEAVGNLGGERGGERSEVR
jgi:hypothetical protein